MVKRRVYKRYRTKKRGGQNYWINKDLDKFNSPYWKKIKRYNIKVLSPSGLSDFGGMNHYAAKELNFKPIPTRNQILIEKDETKLMQSTLLHEITEAELMRKGMRYKTAHKKAVQEELNEGIVPRKVLLENNAILFRQLKNRKVFK